MAIDLTKIKKLPKPVIEEYKGYVIRKLGRLMLAIPKDAVCWYHGMAVGESNKSAMENMKSIIDEGQK